MCVSFERLLIISEKISQVVRAFGSWEEEVRVWIFRWRRTFLVKEKELFENFIVTIFGVVRRGWEYLSIMKPNPKSGFSV